MNPTVNLAVELPTEFARVPIPAAAPDARAVLAAQFIPSGARVLDLSGTGSTLQTLLPHDWSYQCVVAINAGEFPTEAAAQSDGIVMLGVLERIADVENVFTHRLSARRTSSSAAARLISAPTATAVSLVSSTTSAFAIWRFCSTVAASAFSAPHCSATPKLSFG